MKSFKTHIALMSVAFFLASVAYGALAHAEVNPEDAQKRKTDVQERTQRARDAAQEKKGAALERKATAQERAKEVKANVQKRRAEIEVKKEEVKQRMEERRANVQEKRVELAARKEELKKKWEERKVKLAEKHKKIIKTHTERMIKSAQAMIDRLNTLADKTEDRIEIFAGQGADVTSSRAKLEVARAAIVDAQAALDTATVSLAAIAEAPNPGEALGEAKLVFEDVKAALKEARAALVDAIKSFKGFSTVTPPTGE